MNGKRENSLFKIIVAVVLIIETIALSGIIIYLAYEGKPQSGAAVSRSALDFGYSENGKYVLYIGLNDKDTYTQLISTEKAKQIVNDICIKYVDGYTAAEVNGGWVDETDTLTEETSLIYTLNDASEEDVAAILDEVLDSLNQNSILVERQDLFYTYYSGK